MSEIEQWSPTEEGNRKDQAGGGLTSTMSEILAIEDEATRASSRFGHTANDVYVAVGEGTSSMEALSWALRNAVAGPRTCVYLVHVFPEVRSVPTPLGHLPKNQVNPAQLESYMEQVREKTRELLRKFINQCNNFTVNHDTILIESDQIPESVLELIQVLHIQTLVFGVSKRRRRRGNVGKGEKVQKDAPDYCKVKVICEGKEVSALPETPKTSDKSPKSPNTPNLQLSKENELQETTEEKEPTVKCNCFA